MTQPRRTGGPTGDNRHGLGHLPLEQQLAARLPDASGNPAPIGSHVDTTDDVEAARRAWERGEVFSVQTPARAPHSGHPDYDPGTPPEVIARDQARQRRNLRAHRDCAAAPESARACARQELAGQNAARCARGMRRRTPTARPAARRAPAARRRRTASSSRTAGADPPAAEGDDDPPGRAARLTFPHFHSQTAGLSGPERLERFGALPPDAQDACWRHLARELEEARS